MVEDNLAHLTQIFKKRAEKLVNFKKCCGFGAETEIADYGLGSTK